MRTHGDFRADQGRPKPASGAGGPPVFLRCAASHRCAKLGVVYRPRGYCWGHGQNLDRLMRKEHYKPIIRNIWVLVV